MSRALLSTLPILTHSILKLLNTTLVSPICRRKKKNSGPMTLNNLSKVTMLFNDRNRTLTWTVSLQSLCVEALHPIPSHTHSFIQTFITWSRSSTLLRPRCKQQKKATSPPCKETYILSKRQKSKM